MVKTTTLALFLAALAGCSSTKPAPGNTGSASSPDSTPGSGPAPASVPDTVAADTFTKDKADTALSDTPDTSVVSRYCSPGPAPVSLIAMRDSSGYIGAYVFKRLILDSPVSYLDPRGNEVAMFHIFSSPEEKKKNLPIIDSLRAAYPVETPLECPQGGPIGNP